MKNIKCDNCGADMEYVDGQYKCPYCGGIKADLDNKQTEEVFTEAPVYPSKKVPARPLEVIQADYDRSYGLNVKLYVLLFVLSILSMASELVWYFTFFNEGAAVIVPVLALFVFAASYSGVLVLCFYVLDVNYKKYVAVSDELFYAKGGNDPILTKHANKICSIYKIRKLFAILPALEAAFVIFMLFI